MIDPKPILVLASNSFSAASVINHLLTQGKKVIGISRSAEIAPVFRIYGGNPNLKNFIFHKLNLNNSSNKITELINVYKVENIFNFVSQSMVEQSWQNPDQWYQTNVVGLAKLCDLLVRERTIKKFIHFSTPEVYGSTQGWIEESFEFSPSTPYAISRAAGDWHLKCLFERYGFPVIFTRAANVYGPGQQLYRIIPNTIISALLGEKLPLHGGGGSVRSFIHINDVSSALISIMANAKIGESYHISTKEVISILNLVELICSHLDMQVEEVAEVKPERLGKDFAYQLSTEKIRAELAWSDQIPLESGLESVINWVKVNLNILKTFPRTYEHKK
jgi:dTDP-glucose 4,6-dehydratase